MSRNNTSSHLPKFKDLDSKKIPKLSPTESDMSDSKESPIGSQPQGTRGELPEVLVRPSPLLNNNKYHNKYYYRGYEGFNQPGNTPY
jgi:hypothetical protein